jgi:hypothetical protein
MNSAHSFTEGSDWKEDDMKTTDRSSIELQEYGMKTKEEKVDRLFLQKDCADCSVVRAELDMKRVVKDEFRGSSDQKLFVYMAVSTEAAIELLDCFDLGDKKTPVLQTYTGEVRTDVNHILGWLRANDMASKK